MRAIDKRGNFNNYFKKRLVKSVRKLKIIYDSFYEYLSDPYREGDFDLKEHFFLSEIDKQVNFASRMEENGFFDEDYAQLKKRLKLCTQGFCFGTQMPYEFAGIPLNRYLLKNKLMTPFKDYMDINSKQLVFDFQ